MMLAFPLTTTAAVVLLTIALHLTSCGKPPTRNLSVLDRMPQGMGKRQYTSSPQVHSFNTRLQLIPLRAGNGPPHGDATGRPGNSHKGLGDYAYHLRNVYYRLNKRRVAHGMGNPLRPSLDTIQQPSDSVQKHPDSIHQHPGSMYNPDSIRHRGSQQGEEEVGDERYVSLYPQVPVKRGWSGWMTRVRHDKGKGGRGWALGSKRQAVLDRMPLSYGKKRQDSDMLAEEQHLTSNGHVLEHVPVSGGEEGGTVLTSM
ncbi:uncharacterized protein LOC143293512 [Babylonia areolata]|uniref:uncharacterized protein LOC143293512 n=1 Tax=Babylonia areolata TaxID=304850 RepID=UPI003FCF98A0